jgi:hypothetical protein
MRVRISFSKGLVPLLFSSLLMVLCLAGCGEDSNILDNGGNEELEFSVRTCAWNNSNSNSSDQKIPSRATPISTFDTSKSFNVIADVNKGNNWSMEINNETAFYSSINNIWKTSSAHYWTGTGSTVNFYAYYPTSISSNIIHNAGSAPVLSYTVPDNATDQIDILASAKTGVAGDSHNQTPVDLKHLFAAVQFSVGSKGLGSGTISSISIGDVHNSGIYTFGSGWTLRSSTKAFTISQPKAISGTSGEDIYSGIYTLMMIPQTVNNAMITVNYSNGGILTKAISGTWEAGKIYNYGLSFIREYDFTGNVQSFTAPVSGTYKLEAWGAQGQFSIADSVRFAAGGLGGQSSGTINLTKGQPLYIVVGGQGANTDLTDRDGGYNGGGNATWDHHYNDDGGSESCGSGGGCTSITLTNRGTLENFSSYKSEVLIVAGGGGGGCWRTNGGAGGGTSGGVGGDSTITGGTQTTGYAFGHGQPGTTTTDDASDGRPGGGGGWYGGFSKGNDTTSGAGGSGYIGGVTNGSMQNGVQSGNGYARITFISAN